MSLSVLCKIFPVIYDLTNSAISTVLLHLIYLIPFNDPILQNSESAADNSVGSMSK